MDRYEVPTNVFVTTVKEDALRTDSPEVTLRLTLDSKIDLPRDKNVAISIKISPPVNNESSIKIITIDNKKPENFIISPEEDVIDNQYSFTKTSPKEVFAKDNAIVYDTDYSFHKVKIEIGRTSGRERVVM